MIVFLAFANLVSLRIYEHIFDHVDQSNPYVVQLARFCITNLYCSYILNITINSNILYKLLLLLLIYEQYCNMLILNAFLIQNSYILSIKHCKHISLNIYNHSYIVQGIQNRNNYYQLYIY